uniref:Structural maintenance of chromosomes protein n=1 Tax=Globodera pallida TaxID=36090 RepID=A0A183BL97_GLOPA
MYIKEVNITGFRSYKELTTVRNFSSKHNVVVGRNGSGKSNFFTAIQFVLSNDFSSLNQADRHAFLHEGVGSRAPLAKVEIVFDNTDRRIPTENDEVRIMRQVGPKKDQFFIDNKQVTRTEIVNLMESAGFSRSNPYYIVKQGKITELATAADAYRLKLIKEVAGTRVFDEKKDESTKILHDTQAKIAKSVQLLGYINDRLLKLEEEKEDLKEYQKWDKMRRAIEYTIYDLEIKEAKSKYEKLTSHREKINAQQNEVETKLIQAKMSIQEVEMQIHQLETHYKGVKEERTTLLKEQSDLMERKTQLELAIRDLAEDVDRERSGRDMAEQSLRQLKRDIAEKEGQLEKLQPQFERLVEDESRLGSDIRIGEQKCRELYAKQGHQEQFKTVEERDRHLRKEIHWIERRIDETEHQIREIDEAIVEDGKEHERLQTEFQDHARILHEKSVRMDTLNAEEKQKKAELDKAMYVRMENARQEKDVRERLTMVQYEVQQSEQELRRLTSKTVLNGIASLNQVLDELRQSGSNGQNIADGYYGRVIDLFECESQYNKAIEVTAESRLFFHVVRDDRVAMKLLERINQRGLPGELNFYPLNRILVKDRRPVADADASPILDHLQYDPDFEAVFRSIFGNSVFVRDLAAGSRVAKQERFDCVTLDGDQVSRRGPMSGGYIDRKRSKIDLARKLRNFKRERAKLEEQTDVLAQNVAESMTEVERIRLEITKLTMDIQLLSKEHKIVLEKKRSISELLNQHSLNLEPKKNQKTHLGNRIRELEAHRTLVTDQLGTELQSQLSNQEREHVDQIEDDIKAKKEQMDKLMRQRMEAENRIQTLKNQLQSNLLRKRENLNAGHRLATEQSEVKMVNERLNRVLGRLQELELDLGKYDTEKEELSNTLDAHQEGSRELNEQLEECAKNAEIYCTKIANIQSKREECLRKIRDIGSLPADTALGKYDTMGLKQLDRRLTECMNELKKYENVNKKALDQFMRASTQKEELTKRVEELQNNERTIQELLTVLENRRYETLQLTFKQVAKNFEDVFNKLIPQGKANLVMQKDSSADSQQKKPQPVHVMETFVGTSIKVSFTGVQEVREISALSGGQKTLVALALIFAIQKCDPAPFYLFDEIDAALDQEHRRAVAEMIHELSENAQFITTTFRAELLEHSEKFYGVRFRDKMSYIDEISQQQAQDFVQDDQTHS